jgi:spermidine synthase
LYSTEFYALVSHTLAPRGLMVVQAGSPYSTPTAFWRTIDSRLCLRSLAARL